MKHAILATTLAALTSVSATPTKTLKDAPRKRANLPAVTASGNAFYTGSDRWYMRGIDYQPGGASANIDPLADTDICLRDIKEFEDLGVNTIRVYAVDNKKNHDDCMQALNDAGIYLVLDVNNPAYSINRADPHISYNTDYLQSVFATVEMFAKYDNVAAFFSGNEVINDETDTDLSAPYVKATTRDMKNYLRARGLRQVPVGYSAADVSTNRMEQAHYFNCGSDDQRSDFFAFNDYSWCNTDFQTSGWDQKVRNFTDYGIPIFLSEWGCIKNRPREFEELGALMSTNMTGVYSGGLMYEYSVEENNFGIVSIEKSGTVDRNDEFTIFKNALAKYPSPTSGNGGAARESHSVDCPSRSGNWQVDPEGIPEMPSQAQKFMEDGAGEGPGLDGDGSQTSGDSGTATASVSQGQASPTGSSSSDSSGDDDNAALSLQAPLLVTGMAFAFTLFGALLL